MEEKRMIIGVPKEIKNNENRVGMTPGGAKAYIRKGHKVIIETHAGEGSGFHDEEYKAVGCEIYPDVKQLFADADMIIKVKEPLAPEYDLFKEGQILYTYLHLAPAPELTKALLKAKIKGVAFETVQLDNGALPLLTPMSEVAGRMSVQIGATLLQKLNGGLGILLGGVPGTAPAEVVIVGGGNVGTNAAKMAVGLGARVTILDMNAARMAYLDDVFGGRVTTLASNEHNLEESVKKADLLIGAVLIPGKAAPKLVSEDMVKQMKDGAVIVDVAIDQGGSIATIDRVTTHDNPSYIKHGVVHYSVANMPGAVPRTSTIALEAATLPYGLMLADKGLEKAVEENRALMKGLNVYLGNIVYQGVADSLGMPYVDYASVKE
jgi:alanine dehydrogenase